MEVKYTYDKFMLSDIMDNSKFKVPTFQRNVVWNSTKRNEFIKTLKSGNPFGSILVSKINDNCYSLVDGLQRISTIKDYKKNPFNYTSYENIDLDLTDKIIECDYIAQNILFDKSLPAVKEYEKKLRQSIFNDMKLGKDNTDIYFDIIEENKIPQSREVSKAINEIVERFNKEINIDGLIVPTIIYTGPKEELPDIFFNLNTGGVNLSKYETFSAKWDNKLFKIDDSDITDKIIEKYNNLRNKSDLDVDVSDDEIKDNGITLFEYCYSISEILRDKNNGLNILFGENKKSTDPMGFDLIAIICGLPVNKAQNIDDVLMNATPKFLVELKDMILDSFKVIRDILSKWVISLNDTPIVLDSTYMLYHIFMGYINKNYTIDLQNYKIQKNYNKAFNDKFIKYLPSHYLYDYLNDFWKDNRQVSDLTRELNNLEHLTKYSNKISDEKWNTLFVKFRNNQLDEVGGKTISTKAKLFLNYLIKLKLNNNPANNAYIVKKINNDNYIVDYEHIVPMQRLLDKVPSSKISSYPISSIGNLCYLSIKDNRSKHEKTIYEDNNDRPSYCINEDYLKFINYPTKQELNSFIDLEFSEFDSKYRKYLGDRIDELCNDFQTEKNETDF